MPDQGTQGRLSPWLRKQRLNAVRPYLYGRVLDVGCGSGALASMVSPHRYLGFDPDEDSLNLARSHFPNYNFESNLPPFDQKFDSVVALAVIEHVGEPAAFLTLLASYLKTKSGRVILTTPHPSMEWIHTVGAAIGLFSQHASEEHETLLNYEILLTVSVQAGLILVDYKRFLFGANQIAVFKRGL